MTRKYVKQTAEIKIEKLKDRIARMSATIGKKRFRIGQFEAEIAIFQNEIDSRNVATPEETPCSAE